MPGSGLGAIVGIESIQAIQPATRSSAASHAIISGQRRRIGRCKLTVSTGGSMAIDIAYDHFSTEQEAVAEIQEKGYWPLTLNFEAETNDCHWHDFDSVVFVLEGKLGITETGTGESCVCGPGTRIEAKAGVLHNEEHQGYRAVIGFGIDPATLTQPINKPPPVTL
jgi:hypothetical protein